LSAKTQAFFIVSSGRSGTAMLHKALSAVPDVDMHHEYMVHVVQPLAVRRYMKLIDVGTARRKLRDTHLSAVLYSEHAHWGDSSNKLSWLIPELAELLPDAKFVHLVRDGRKVSGSYFRKLGAECYDDRSVQALRRFSEDPAGTIAPPPEKKYWWPLPRKGDCFEEAFKTFDQFQRIAWHWTEINRVIFESLSALPAERSRFVRLEDLQSSPSAVKELFHFLHLPYQDENFSVFARPHNVNRPEDRLLDSEQNAQFDIIARTMMERLGYGDRAEYVVNY
jgi:hypothetical protein